MTAVNDPDMERKLHNTRVLSGTVLMDSEDSRGKRLIATKDGKTWAWNEKHQRYMEVTVVAGYWKE